MYEHITFACVAWNDAERLDKLLWRVRPWFKTLAVVVQESPDDTLRVAEKWADIVEADEHRGYGDASFGPKLQPLIRTEWTFKVDADEMPSLELLASLGVMTEAADREGVRGVWVPFRSWVEGVEWEEQHAHLRLWHNSIRWPSTLHSRPMIEDTIRAVDFHIPGHISHVRSLDEMMRDYLSYYEIGSGDPGWTAHNRMMMHDACLAAAQREGWGYVQSFDWWPQVKAVTFTRKEDYMLVFCAGPSCSGTRMLFDMVGRLGFTAVHASIPGYYDKPAGGLDTDNPNWWPVSEWEERYGKGKWVVMTRDPEFSGRCAVKRGFVASTKEYPAFRQRALDILAEVPGMDSYQLAYEQFVADPQGEFDKLADWLGAEHASVGDIFDGNQKYLDASAATKAPRKPRTRKTSGRSTPA